MRKANTSLQKWIVMLIVLAIGLSALAILGTWLKRCHDRKRDEPNTSFNEGITTRTAPSNPNLGGMSEKTNSSAAPIPPAAPGLSPSASGRNSPIRTREAFMPYGYNYTRSESRLASGASASQDAIESVPPPNVGANDRSIPLARGGTPVGELEKGGVEGTPTGQFKRKKVLVRERSVEDDVGTPTKAPK